MKELRNRDVGELSQGEYVDFQTRVQFCKKAGPDQQPDHTTKKSIECSRSDCSGNRARTITQQAKSNTEDEPPDDI